MSKVYIQQPGKDSAASKKKKRLKIIFYWITVVATLLGLITAVDWFVQKSKTDKEIDKEQYWISGILLPPSLLHPEDSLYVEFGQVGHGGSYVMFRIGELMQEAQVLPRGAQFRPMGQLECDGKPTPLRFSIENGTLYISDTIRYLLDDEIIGIIKSNHWDLYKPNKLKYYSDQTGIEILDKQGHIVRSVRFIYPNRIQVIGYFLTPNLAYVASDAFYSCFPRSYKNWKDSVVAFIERAPSIRK